MADARSTVRFFPSLIPGWDAVVAVEGPSESEPNETCSLVTRAYRIGCPGDVVTMAVGYERPKGYDVAMGVLHDDEKVRSVTSDVLRGAASIFTSQEVSSDQEQRDG